MSKDIGISVEELVLEEREFLHEVSNHTSIAHGMINIVLKKMKAGQEIDEKLLSKQQKAIDALNKQMRLMKDRRNLLHTRS